MSALWCKDKDIELTSAISVGESSAASPVKHHWTCLSLETVHRVGSNRGESDGEKRQSTEKI